MRLLLTLLFCTLKTDMFLSFSFPMASWARIHTPFRRGTSLLSTLTPKSTTVAPKVATGTTITNRRRPKVLFVLGGPGAGKGTQCAMLSSEYGMQHLSAGELLREEIASGSSTGKMIATIINEGKIVPVQISLDLIRAKIESIPCNRFLVDGFPRNWDNVQGWDNCMTQVCDVEAVMFIDCPEAELEKRLLSRGQTSGRSDDNAATARKRFATFKEATMPIVEHFELQQKLIRVPGHLSVANVFLEMKLAIVPFIEQEIIHLTGVLLDAIAEKDWQTYITLVDPSLTCFEKEAQGTTYLNPSYNPKLILTLHHLSLNPLQSIIN